MFNPFKRINELEAIIDTFTRLVVEQDARIDAFYDWAADLVDSQNANNEEHDEFINDHIDVLDGHADAIESLQTQVDGLRAHGVLSNAALSLISDEVFPATPKETVNV